MNFDEKAFSQFMSECNDKLEHFESDLFNLEKDNNNNEIVDSLYRTMHTIKGSSSLLGLDSIVELAHKSESILNSIKESEASVNASLIELFFKVNDEFRTILSYLDRYQDDFNYDTSQVINDLDKTAKNLGIADSTKAKNIEKIEDLSNFSAAQIKALESLGAIKQEAKENKEPINLNKKSKEQTIRVKLSTLDTLSAQVAELMATKDQLAELGLIDPGVTSLFKQFNKITKDLRTTVISTRMQSLSSIENKLKRAVRDTAHELNKEVDFDIEGSSIQLDRAILESIVDPLVHIIRNSIDHGIEDVQTRLDLSKPEAGQLKLEAKYDSVWVSLTFSDDGRGISVPAVKKKAIAKGIISREKADNLNDHQILDLIFDSGFSTKDEVSRISGRGVGMDIVKSSINQINGQIELESSKNKGTKIKIKVPITLAIAKAIIVEISGQVFALPQNIVEEFTFVEPEMIKFDIEFDNFFFEIGEQKIPLVLASQFLEYLATGALFKGCDLREHYFSSGRLNVLLINFEGYNYALAIDQILNLRDIVVKPLNLRIHNSEYFAGATVFSDSSAGLILDARAIASLFDIKPQEINPHKKNTFLESIRLDKKPVLFFNYNQKKYSMGISFEHKFDRVPSSLVRKTIAGKFIDYDSKSIRMLELSELFLDEICTLEDEEQRYLEILLVEISGRSFCICLGQNYSLDFLTEEEMETLEDEIDLGELSRSILGAFAKELISEPVVEEPQKMILEKASFISFRLADYLFAFNLKDVQEVMRKNRISILDTVHPEIEGLINIRGDVVSSFKLASILGIEEGAIPERSKLNEYVVVNAKDLKFALAVDSVNSIHSLSKTSQLNDLRHVPENVMKYSSEFYNIGSEILTILDPHKLVENFIHL